MKDTPEGEVANSISERYHGRGASHNTPLHIIADRLSSNKYWDAIFKFLVNIYKDEEPDLLVQIVSIKNYYGDSPLTLAKEKGWTMVLNQIKDSDNESLMKLQEELTQLLHKHQPIDETK